MPFLLKQQKNELLEDIQRNGFDPRDFSWAGRSHPELLEYKIPGNYFGIRRDTDYIVTLAPPFDVDSLRTFYSGVRLWSEVRAIFGRWLHGLKTESEAPDLWAELGNQIDERTAAALLRLTWKDVADNTPIPLAELGSLHQKLDEIPALIEAHDEKIAQAVNSAVREIKDSSQRLGRKDWIMLTLGIVVSLFVSAALPPEVLRAFCQHLVNAISGWAAHQLR